MRNIKEMTAALQRCENFKTFYEKNKQHMITEPLAQQLCDLLKAKGLKKSGVIKKAEIAEVYGYQIFSGIRQPERKKLLCLALGMDLSLEETQVILTNTGYPPLYVRRPFDSVVMFGICKKLPVAQINELLFSYNLETLG